MLEGMEGKRKERHKRDSKGRYINGREQEKIERCLLGKV